MGRQTRKLIDLAACVVALSWAVVAAAPAAQAARVFPEPIDSTDFIKHGGPTGPSQLADGFRELERRYPGFIDFTTIQRELGDPNAVSLGADGKPAWDPSDAHDGLPFYVAKVTDESVPDAGKAYVLLLNAHPAEPCGNESHPRFLEDLLTWRATDPGHVLDAGTGLYGRPESITVAELLRKVKIFFVSTSPDDWYAADSGQADNKNNAGFNTNRVAYQDGWVFPADKGLFDRGFSTLTQPEGIAVSRYLLDVRARELGGRPFAVANDQHGPLPTSGALLFHDQGSDPAKLDRLNDYAERLKQKMEEVFARYFTGAGETGSQELAGRAGDVRDLLLHKYTELTGQPVTEKALFLTLQWAEYASIWDHLDYTVTGSWGGWAGSHAGLDADSMSFETACDAQTKKWNPALFQLFVDNVRAEDQTGVVVAAQRTGDAAPPPVATYDLGGRVGYVDTGQRVTDRDGNPHPPPAGHPGSPFYPQIQQAPYDVSNTDYFRDLRGIVTTPIEAIPAAKLAARAQKVDSLVVADTDAVDAQALKRFAEGGGNLVLTDSALRLLPKLLEVAPASVRENFSYVGYSDLVRTHPWTEGLYKRARQTFDPVGLGRPLLMERDQYWPCNPSCDRSPTQNSAPIWTVDRTSWERLGGDVVGTADPPSDRKFAGEGTRTDKVTIGAAPLGKGRVVIFGALLPQPSEADEHWFGLDAYTVSIGGQRMLLHALRWGAKERSAPVTRACKGRERLVVQLPRSVHGRPVVRGRVTVGGRRARVRRVNGRLVALIDLRGRRGGRVTVRVTSIARDGRRRVQTRRFRVCAPPVPAPPVPPRSQQPKDF
jgi:hypothetical protein